jgi:hypothetical protein
MYYPNLGKRMMYNESMELVPDTTQEQNVDLSEYRARHYRDPLDFLVNQSILDPRIGETVMVKQPTVKQVLLSPIYRTRDNVRSVIDYLKFFGGNSSLYIPTIEELETNKSK